MSPLEFAYWLRGFFEIGGERALTKEEATIISQHLALVFDEQAKSKKPVSKVDWQKELEAIKREKCDGPLDPRSQAACAQVPNQVNASVAPNYVEDVEDYDPMTGGPLYCTVSCSPKDSKAWDL